MSALKVLITAGGTGGHLFPAQSLACDLNKNFSSAEVLFVAGGLNKNLYFDRERHLFKEIDCSPLLSKNPLKAAKGLFHLSKAFVQSVRILKAFKPDVVVGFGSYYTVAPLLAAKWLNIPIVLHEANSIPGKANQWLSSTADCIALHFPSAASFFKKKCIEVGLPLRENYQKSSLTKADALRYYHLCDNQPTLLICGGSQGARAINQLLIESIPFLKEFSCKEALVQ